MSQRDIEANDEMLERGNTESWRMLMPFGILIFLFFVLVFTVIAR